MANSSTAYIILYRMTDSLYQPTWVVTTLFIHNTAATAIGETLLSCEIVYVSPDLNFSPSYLLYAGAPRPITNALGRGWHVMTGDNEGPKASSSAGVMSGQAVLDEARSILPASCRERFGLRVRDVKYASWGNSGGVLAAELQVWYAPELEFVGAAMGCLTPNVTSV